MLHRLAAPIAIALALLSGCSSGEPLRPGEHEYDRLRVGPGDILDAATTHYGLTMPGIEEANPILAPFGKGAGLVSIPVKYGIKQLIVQGGGSPVTANIAVESASMGAGCINLVTITGGTIAAGIAAGIFCGILTRNHMRDKYEQETGRMVRYGYREPITLPLKDGQKLIPVKSE